MAHGDHRFPGLRVGVVIDPQVVLLVAVCVVGVVFAVYIRPVEMLVVLPL